MNRRGIKGDKSQEGIRKCKDIFIALLLNVLLTIVHNLFIYGPNNVFPFIILHSGR